MDETRSDQIRIRCTPEEKERIEAMAEEFEQRTADYVRNTALAGPVLEDAPEVVAQVIEAQQTGEKPPPLKGDRLSWLVSRITELHRDTERRWPGRRARVQADAEWPKYLAGEELPKIPQREITKAATPKRMS